METAAIVPYGTDSQHRGKRCGPETTKILEKTIALVCALEDKHCTIYLGSGSLKELMAQHLVRRFEVILNDRRAKSRTLFIMPTIVIAEMYAADTIAETVAVTKEMLKHDVTECYFVSSWYRLPRVLFIWSRMDGFSFYLVIAWFAWAWSPLLNMLAEPFKLFCTVALRKMRDRIPQFLIKQKPAEPIALELIM